MQWSLPTLDLESSIAIKFVVFNATVTRLTLVKGWSAYYLVNFFHFDGEGDEVLFNCFGCYLVLHFVCTCCYLSLFSFLLPLNAVLFAYLFLLSFLQTSVVFAYRVLASF
jgi:hypothetical protein